MADDHPYNKTVLESLLYMNIIYEYYIGTFVSVIIYDVSCSLTAFFPSEVTYGSSPSGGESCPMYAVNECLE